MTSNKRILKSVSDYADSVANKRLVKRNGPSVYTLIFFSLAFFFFFFFFFIVTLIIIFL